MAWEIPKPVDWQGQRTEDIQRALIDELTALGNDLLTDKRIINILKAMCVLIFRNNTFK